jgi:hypothetical protein
MSSSSASSNAMRSECRALFIAASLLAACATGDERKLGDLCARDDQCASSRCDERVCRAAAPAAAGEPCRHPLECRSERCVDGRCGPGLRADGADCTDDLQCQSGRCLQGSCGGIDAGRDGGPTSDGPMNDAGVDAGPLADAGNDAGWVEVPASVVWVKRFGDEAHEEGLALAVDQAGNLYLGGQFRLTVDFGGQSLTSTAFSVDAFIASYTGAGALRWCQPYGDIGKDLGLGVAVGGDGNVALTGDLDVDTTTRDLFLASFAGADGTPRWSHRLGGTGDDGAGAVTADASGNLYLVGEFSDTVDFGGGSRTSAGGLDTLVASYDADGLHRWSHDHGGPSDDGARAVALDDSGNLYVSGRFFNFATFGGSWYVTMGLSDVRGLYVAGVFTDETDLGGGPLLSVGSHTAFAARYASADGGHVWSRHLPASGDTWVSRVALGPRGNVYLWGSYRGSVNLGPADLTSAGGVDLFVVSMTPDGRFRWAKSFGGVMDDGEGGLAIDAAGAVYLSGSFDSFADFEQEQFVSAGRRDIFLLKIVEHDAP